MELQHLRVFLVVAEELHFGRAAERLHLAQPPVTRSIQHLERELGVTLFDRSHRAVHLTAAGEALVRPARDVLEAVERVRSAVTASRSGVVGRVRVGYAGASTRILVARLVSSVGQQAPGIEMHLHSQTYPRLVSDVFAQPVMSGVLSGDLDLGVGRWGLIPAGIETRVLMIESLVMAVSRDHPFASRGSVSMADFRDEPIVSSPRHAGSVLFDRLLRLCYAAGFEPGIVQTAPDTWGALALVAEGLGSWLAPSGVADCICDPEVVFLPVTDEAEPILMRMAWRRGHQNPAVDSVLRLSEKVLPTPE